MSKIIRETVFNPIKRSIPLASPRMLFFSYHVRQTHGLHTATMASALNLFCSSSFNLNHRYVENPCETPPLQIPNALHYPPKIYGFKQMCKEGRLREAFESFGAFFTSQTTFQLACEVYSSLLELCAGKEALDQGKQIHAHILTYPVFSDDVFLSTKLVFMYGKCGVLSDARRLFDGLSRRTSFTWNALIGAYASNEQFSEALELYKGMLDSGIIGDSHTFPCVIKACGGLKDLNLGAQIHCLAVKSGFGSSVFVLNSLVAMYAKCEDFRGAYQVFDIMPERSDVVSWNSIISAYSQSGYSVEALSLFREMQRAGIAMNSYTVVGVLQACADLSLVKLGKEIHAALLKLGLAFDVYEANALVVLYAKSSRMGDASLVFKEMPKRDNISWNSMLSGYVQNGFYDEALCFYRKMHEEGQKLDQVSLISISSASGRLGNLMNGMEIHAYAIKHSLASDLQVGNTIIDMYTKCSCLHYATCVFNRMPEKDVISWTTIIAGLAQNGSYLESLKLFREVQLEGMEVDSKMIGSILLTCSGSEYISIVKQIHGYIIRHALFDLVLENAIIDVYGECGKIEYAVRVFERTVNKNIVSWTSMITCYIHNGLPAEALDLFYDMKEAGIEPDTITLVCMLSACACLSALRKGKEIHGFLIRKCFYVDGSLGNSLVDMYAKCGTVESSYKVFERSRRKDLVLWTSMITASGIHGRGKDAIDLFSRMRKVDLIPDHITFLALLYACSHGGLIEEGKKYFDSMKNEYHLEPWPEHYACMVDLLGRSDCMNEAYDFIKGMPIEPTAPVWCALLGACWIHSDNKLGLFASQKLLELEPECPGNYVLASNVFAAAGEWNNVEQVRMRMKQRGLKKNPACSWIEVGNEVHSFIAGDKSHPKILEIYSKLNEIRDKLEREGYVAETKFVLHNVGEVEKVKMLYGHCERLAIAFGLVSTPQGTPIRITKNLRVCGDCHGFTKLVSKIFKRVIIVRDTNRFHHFERGFCSCGDFW